RQGALMTTFRLIPLPYRAALQLLLGVVALVAPFAIGVSVAGAIITVLAGTAIVGLALAGIVDERGFTQLPVRTLYGFDQTAALGLFIGAAALAISGDAPGGVILALVAAAMSALTLTTRYSLSS